MGMEHQWNATDKETHGTQALSAPLWTGLGSDPAFRMDICQRWVMLFIRCKYMTVGYAVAQWLRHCAINRKVAESIPDGAVRIFH
jgi:hypothetical protein